MKNAIDTAIKYPNLTKVIAYVNGGFDLPGDEKKYLVEMKEKNLSAANATYLGYYAEGMSLDRLEKGATAIIKDGWEAMPFPGDEPDFDKLCKSNKDVRLVVKMVDNAERN